MGDGAHLLKDSSFNFLQFCLPRGTHALQGLPGELLLLLAHTNTITSQAGWGKMVTSW